MSKTIYVAGKITGLPDLNKPKFDAAVRELRSRGFIVRNPHEICDGLPEEEWHKCMRKCIAVMMECDIVVLLDDWVFSRGAIIESNLASDIGIEVEHYAIFLRNHDAKVKEVAA
jgi:hypothetical protein